MRADSWQSYLTATEKRDYLLWSTCDRISQQTSFFFVLAAIAAGAPLLLRLLARWIEGIGTIHGTFVTHAPALFPAFVAVIVALAVLNRVANQWCARLETEGKGRQRVHDKVVTLARATVRIARLAEPVKAALGRQTTERLYRSQLHFGA